MKGLGSGIFEIVDNFNTDTYRAVYAVQLANNLYVLHVFQKKSKQVIKTPKKEIDLIKERLKQAKGIAYD
jgi:phage-related protein